MRYFLVESKKLLSISEFDISMGRLKFIFRVPTKRIVYNHLKLIINRVIVDSIGSKILPYYMQVGRRKPATRNYINRLFWINIVDLEEIPEGYKWYKPNIWYNVIT